MPTYQEALDKANEISAKLTIYDFGPENRWVMVIDEEGCVVLRNSAFVLQWHHWFLVFAEHHPPAVYPKTETTEIRELTEASQDEDWWGLRDADEYKPKKPPRKKKPLPKIGGDR